MLDVFVEPATTRDPEQLLAWPSPVELELLLASEGAGGCVLGRGIGGTGGRGMGFRRPASAFGRGASDCLTW